MRNLAALIAALIATSACAGRGTPLAPSPVILPDAIVVSAGETQTFSVQYATVVGFTVRTEHGDWTDCLRIDAAYRVDNSIRLIVDRPCGGFVYVTANLGASQTPLVALLAIR